MATDTKASAAGIAVLLNANAKQVNGRVHRALSDVVPAGDLFFSRSAEEAREIAERVVSRRYGTVFTGGGDGTFVSWVNQILDRAEKESVPAPRFGVLALGTGNAVAEMVGARPEEHVRDLARYIRGEVPFFRRLDLLTCLGRRTPFAGVGVDAAVLNDYNWIHRRLSKTALRSLGTGPAGYGLAVLLRSVPRACVERRAAYCEIVNSGRPAWRLDDQGRKVGSAVQTGELLYAGPCVMAAASTVPYYGLGLRLFPFAQSRPGMMQLRVATRLDLPALLLNLPSIWSGTFTHPSILDFQAEQVAMRFERPMPLQVGGDASGWHEEAGFGMARQPVELVDFGSAAARAAA
jgi:diacylglycerol kinase family enzyme